MIFRIAEIGTDFAAKRIYTAGYNEDIQRELDQSFRKRFTMTEQNNEIPVNETQSEEIRAQKMAAKRPFCNSRRLFDPCSGCQTVLFSDWIAVRSSDLCKQPLLLSDSGLSVSAVDELTKFLEG
jgi:hypothetical protein